MTRGDTHLPVPWSMVIDALTSQAAARPKADPTHADIGIMTEFRSEFLNVLSERGFIHQLTDATALDARAAKGTITAYTGFDATADSLHIGSLVQIMMLHWLQKTGHRPIVLMGGGTTKVGDPTGKDESRQLLSDAAIASNIAGIRRNFEPFLRFGDQGPHDEVRRQRNVLSHIERAVVVIERS